jgi:hypothetical protein
MKKKVFVLALALSVFTIFNASAFTAAIGGEFGLPIGGSLPDSSALLSFRVPKVPVVFGLGAYIPKNGENGSFALMADWWLAQGNLVSFINYYVGPGVFVGIGNNSEFGIRVPVGLNVFPVKPLELFVEFAPAVTLLAPGAISIPNWSLQTGFGFRFWF